MYEKICQIAERWSCSIEADSCKGHCPGLQSVLVAMNFSQLNPDSPRMMSCIQDAAKLTHVLEEAALAVHGQAALPPAPKHLLASVDLARPGGLVRAADDPPTLESAAEALSGWCSAVEVLLEEPETRRCARAVAC